VLTIWTNVKEREEAEQLKQYCYRVHSLPLSRWRSLWNCTWALPGHLPLQVVYSWQKRLLTRLPQEELDVDVIHVEHLRGSRYGLYLKKHTPHLPIVWDSVDCISLLFRQAVSHSQRLMSRWLTRFELGRTERYEGQMMNKFEHVLVTSPVDRQALMALIPPNCQPAPVSIVSNGVDVDYFSPEDNDSRAEATLVVSGKMSYHANVTMVLHLVDDVMPYIWARRPEVKLQVVGKDPPATLIALAENPAVSIIGSVSDIRPYLQRATVAVAPVLYGVGIQNKVLEAMACATPVVSTPQITSAINAQADQEILIAKEPLEFAEKVLFLLENASRRHVIGRAGRVYVEQNHQWSRIATQLESIYLSLIEKA
jgi:glycosyltransferase involved in cell wall biosynthesis